MEYACFTPDGSVAAVLLKQASSAVLDESGRTPPPTGMLFLRTDPLGRASCRDTGAVSAVIEAQAASSSVVALVLSGRAACRQVRLLDVGSGAALTDLEFEGTVRAVKLNLTRMVVALAEGALHIFDVRGSLRLLQKLDVPAMHLEPRGPLSPAPLALSGDATCLVAVPASKPGAVLVYDALRLSVVALVPAHQTSVALVALSWDGRLLASTSDRGTVVRLFHLPSGEPAGVFRRGHTPAVVTVLAFGGGGSSSGTPARLVVGSETGTLHVFDVGAVLRRTASTAAAAAGDAGAGLAAAVRDWVPSNVADLFSERSASVARVASCPRAAAFHRDALRVVTTDAVLLEFGPPDAAGGDLKLVSSVDLARVV